jgi:hypothetical protein
MMPQPLFFHSGDLPLLHLGVDSEELARLGGEDGLGANRELR